MKIRSRSVLLSLALSSVFVLAAIPSHAAQTYRISVDSAGAEGNIDSFYSSVSADGRFVVFASDAANLVLNDTNGFGDIFVHDRATGQTTRVSVDSAGGEGNNYSSFPPAISADGRYVAFGAYASNLVPGDTNGLPDTFVHDRLTGQTTRVSVDSAGAEAAGDSGGALAISADGRYVVFASDAANLVPGDTNGVQDLFVHDRRTGKTKRVSVDSAGLQGDGASCTPSISGDGRYVTYESDATNLVPGDTNAVQDIFVRDQVTNTTTRVSVDSAGAQSDGDSEHPQLNADGRFVTYDSAATNLVPGDTNSSKDVFLYNRTTGTTTRISVDSAGVQGDGDSDYPTSVSADGRYVSFDSDAANLVPGDTLGVTDVFIKDRFSGAVSRLSVDKTWAQGNDTSYNPSFSADGRIVVFTSGASNLVPGDTNSVYDVFIRDRALIAYPQVDLQLVVTSAPASVAKNATASYVFTMTNTGIKPVSEVTFFDVSSKMVMTLTPSQGACTSKSAVSLCKIGSLAPGASATVNAVFTASLSPLTQQLTVSAAQADVVPANNSAFVSTTVTP